MPRYLTDDYLYFGALSTLIILVVTTFLVFSPPSSATQGPSNTQVSIKYKGIKESPAAKALRNRHNKFVRSLNQQSFPCAKIAAFNEMQLSGMYKVKCYTDTNKTAKKFYFFNEKSGFVSSL